MDHQGVMGQSSQRLRSQRVIWKWSYYEGAYTRDEGASDF